MRAHCTPRMSKVSVLVVSVALDMRMSWGLDVNGLRLFPSAPARVLRAEPFASFVLAPGVD